MDENQALLGKDFDVGRQERCRTYDRYQDEYSDGGRGGSTSDDSDEWWDDSHSSCGSSCCSTDSGSSLAWEREVNEHGELFYIESDNCPVLPPPSEDQTSETATLDNAARENKAETDKKGKFARWMRRRESKRLRPKLSLPESPRQGRSNPAATSKATESSIISQETREIAFNVESLGSGDTPSERLLGVKVAIQPQEQVRVTGFVANAPITKCKGVTIGDILRKINGAEVTPQNLDGLLRGIALPSDIVLEVESHSHSGGDSKDPKMRNQSHLVRLLTEHGKPLENTFDEQSVGVVFINMDKQTTEKKDIVYSFPEKSALVEGRGSFVTLYHLLTEILKTNQCMSSSVIIRKQLSHVLYKPEDNCLLLVNVPDSKCSLNEAMNISNDLVRCLQFNYQTLNRCFSTCKKKDLDHFFTVFFSRVLTTGFSPGAAGAVAFENLPGKTIDPPPGEFEDILPYAQWIPLPREVQIQVDDALNELEANDFDYDGDESIENQRLYNIIGSCFYHKGYLIASHLPKDDLIDVHSFCRQNCITQVMRTESVKSLIVWREVFPSSVNRGLPSASPKSNGYPLPQGRWFLLLLGQGHDLLGVILESGGCCVKAEANPGPSLEYIEETEDTLIHIQKLGISSLASQWLRDNLNCSVVSPEEIFLNKTNKKRDNLLSFVKTLDGTGRTQGGATPPSITRNPSDVNALMKSRLSQNGETSEDSISQAPSNVSEVSDENAPILGRRAERVKNVRPGSDSDNSDSDWESFKDCNRHDVNSSGCGSSGILRGPYFSDLNAVIPSKLTTGPENTLFHYVHLDCSEGVFMSPMLTAKNSPKMNEIIDKFRKSAMMIHTLLQNNVRFKKNSHESSKCFINKSLIAVKEHGILIECVAPESDGANKRVTFSYWVVGRLFFTPQPREVYVCYYDEAPQNLVEIAFRLGLNAGG